MTKKEKARRGGRPQDLEPSRFFALRAADQDAAFDDMRAFATALRSAGIGSLRRTVSEDVRFGERFRWLLNSEEGRLSAVIHDDTTMPAMVLEVTASPALMPRALRLVESSFDIAPAKEVFETAKVEQRDDPKMLVLAAWVAEPEDEAALIQLLRAASEDADVELRRASSQAAMVQATEPMRQLVKDLLAKETDAQLISQLHKVLERWKP